MAIQHFLLFDPELQPYLARDALRGLNRLLAMMPPGETIECDLIGAQLRLIEQAAQQPR